MRFSLLATLVSTTLGQADKFRDTYSDNSFNLAQTENVDWMSKLPDNAEVSALSISGTHHSATSFISNRGFDTDYDLGDILAIISNFLKRNPREALFLRIQKSRLGPGNDKDFEAAIKQYLEPDTQLGRLIKNQLYQSSTPVKSWRAPQMSEIRGRISSEPLVISNFKFAMKTIGMSVKWTKVKKAIEKSSQEQDKKLHIIHTSVSVGSFPYLSAGGTHKHKRKGLNDALSKHLQTHSTPHIRIIVMDFPGKNLVNQIIGNSALMYP
ncbi:uncharacterized protein BROUX77_003954 [Berkeleyomyces rouxiae]|uniref:uncharacterized protein n=1 Tax=Berkeleyomyces rouxiae TaxID=2035830 RepID=UPI003B7E70B2